MDMTIDQQVAIDEALVPHAHKLRIGRGNFRLLSDISSKESTIQLVLPGQSFVEPPFEEEILAFLWFLGHSGAIRRLTDVQHKDTKKSNEMYYPRFTKEIIHHFMSKDPSIPRRNKVNWHYVRDDHMFTTIKLVSRHQNTQQFGALLPIELTNANIRNSYAYKEYYAVATGATPPKPKASVWKTRSSSDTTVTPLTTAAGPRLVLDVPTDESEEEISWNSTDEEGDDKGDDGDDDEVNDEDNQEEGNNDEQASNEEDFIHPSLSTHVKEETRDEESFDPIPKTHENTNDEGNGEENLGMNVGREEGQDEENEEDELYRDVNINLGRGIKSIFETTSQMDVQTPTSVAPLPVFAPTLTPSTIATITTTQHHKNPTADMGMKGKAVKPSACWTWKPSHKLANKGPKNNSVSVMFKKYTYIDTQGRLNGVNSLAGTTHQLSSGNISSPAVAKQL
nr:hypothetical protein [Tanacetum cinerariifolium]